MNVYPGWASKLVKYWKPCRSVHCIKSLGSGQWRISGSPGVARHVSLVADRWRKPWQQFLYALWNHIGSLTPSHPTGAWRCGWAEFEPGVFLEAQEAYHMMIVTGWPISLVLYSWMMLVSRRLEVGSHVPKRAWTALSGAPRGDGRWLWKSLRECHLGWEPYQPEFLLQPLCPIPCRWAVKLWYDMALLHGFNCIVTRKGWFNRME